MLTKERNPERDQIEILLRDIDSASCYSLIRFFSASSARSFSASARSFFSKARPLLCVEIVRRLTFSDFRPSYVTRGIQNDETRRNLYRPPGCFIFSPLRLFTAVFLKVAVILVLTDHRREKLIHREFDAGK